MMDNGRERVQNFHCQASLILSDLSSRRVESCQTSLSPLHSPPHPPSNIPNSSTNIPNSPTNIPTTTMPPPTTTRPPSPPCTPTGTIPPHPPFPDYPPSSPPSPAPPKPTTKPKKPPTITPKRLTRFFTPRSRHLDDITNTTSTAPDAARAPKRRRLSIDTSVSGPPSSPLQHAAPPRLFPDADADAASPVFPAPIRRLAASGPTRRILERSFGGHAAHARVPPGADHAADWRWAATRLVSHPRDRFTFPADALPYVAASCHTNPLVALADEAGTIRIVDSARSAAFSTTHVSFRPHRNAIFDLDFSADDALLASASGDMSARITDMRTQRTLAVLAAHSASVKQVRFRPGASPNELSTSARDGTVRIWDLRCGGATVQRLRAAIGEGTDAPAPPRRAPIHRLPAGLAARARPGAPPVSVTAMLHLPHGRAHQLLTSSEAGAGIQVWDLRRVGGGTNAGAGGSGATAPAAQLAAPRAHARTRPFGVSALVGSEDGARVWAVCRDGVVWGWGTGAATPGGAGAGPLYGLAHAGLRVGSFYVKAAVRGELLAVGNSEGAPVVFGTGGKSEGTALRGAHGREVTSVAWTPGGELVAVGDDCAASCWREDGARAEELREGGGGERWGWGCADEM